MIMLFFKHSGSRNILNLLLSFIVDAKCELICTKDFNPVCGSDGNTYTNECFMKAESCRLNMTITVSKRGSCEDPGICKDNNYFSCIMIL